MNLKEIKESLSLRKSLQKTYGIDESIVRKIINKVKKDDVIRMANEMIAKENLITNEEVEYEVLLAHDNGNTEFIHRVEKSGKRSI